MTKILYQNGNHWVTTNAHGDYEVYRNEGAAAVKRATIGRRFGTDPFGRAKEECDRREHSAEASFADDEAAAIKRQGGKADW